MPRWTPQHASDLYNVPAWSQGYFRVNELGNLELTPPDRVGRIDLRVLVDDLVSRGIELPVLLRFTDLVRARVRWLDDLKIATRQQLAAIGDEARVPRQLNGIFRSTKGGRADTFASGQHRPR